MSAGRCAGRRPVCGVLSAQTCTAAIAGRCPTARNGGPAGPGLAVSAADTRVSVSGSGRLQSADAALCLTVTGQATVLEMGRYSSRHVRVLLRRTNNTLLGFLPRLWSDLYGLEIEGEQRQHLQAIDIRAEQGMMDTEQWYILPTLSHGTCDKVLCSYCLCWTSVMSL